MINKKYVGPAIALVASILAFFILFFGFSKIPPEIRNPEKSAGSSSIETFIEKDELAYRDSLGSEEQIELDKLIQLLKSAPDDSSKVNYLKEISGFWYKNHQVGLAAEYAQKVAMLDPSGESWSIAATNFILAAKQSSQEDPQRLNWIEKARNGFRQALLVDSSNIIFKVNLALIDVEFPPSGQPMSGILQLRKLSDQYPDNTIVLYHLARLAIETNQLDRAKERLAKLFSLDPGFSRAYCLLAEIAQRENDSSSFKKFQEKCKE